MKGNDSPVHVRSPTTVKARDAVIALTLPDLVQAIKAVTVHSGLFSPVCIPPVPYLGVCRLRERDLPS